MQQEVSELISHVLAEPLDHFLSLSNHLIRRTNQLLVKMILLLTASRQVILWSLCERSESLCDVARLG